MAVTTSIPILPVGKVVLLMAQVWLVTAISAPTPCLNSWDTLTVPVYRLAEYAFFNPVGHLMRLEAEVHS